MKSFERYSHYYDLIYQDKDYKAECDFVKDIFSQYSKEPVTKILDVGCGTGGHALLLAQSDYHVTGIDLSQTMIDRAKTKAKTKLQVDFHTVNICSMDLGKKFDACISMFAAMGYITENSNIKTALMNIRKHLNNGSLFIFDFWNGLAVLRVLPSTKVKVVEDKGIKLIRIGVPELDAFHHTCQVKYHLIISKNNRLVDEIEETHNMRFYFPQEIIYYLQDANFEVLEICPFLELGGNVDENTWNITTIARAI